MNLLDEISAAGDLWVKVVEQAMKDLVSYNTNLAVRAARYFFREPVESDRHNIKTFAGLCAATGINADAAAKAVFTGLKSWQQERIYGLLKRAGYNV